MRLSPGSSGPTGAWSPGWNSGFLSDSSRYAPIPDTGNCWTGWDSHNDEDPGACSRPRKARNGGRCAKTRIKKRRVVTTVVTTGASRADAGWRRVGVSALDDTGQRWASLAGVASAAD